MAKGYATFANNAGDAEPPPPHPQTQAWWPSRVFLSWVTPLMTLGNRKQLDEHDIWPLQEYQQTAHVAVKFGRDYDETKSLARTFLRSFALRYVLVGLAFFTSTACTFMGPIVLNRVVSELTTDAYDVHQLTRWILALFGSQLLQALADNYATFEAEVMGLQFIFVLKTLMYRKALKLNAESRKLKSTGEITNMYSNDCSYLMQAAVSFYSIVTVPVQLFFVGYLLYRLLGVAAVAGLAIVGFALGINQLLFSTVYKVLNGYMQAEDARMKVVTETFKFISIIKFNAWEEPFFKRIIAAREKELAALWRFFLLIATITVATNGLPVFVSVTTFGVYAGLLKHELTPAIVFTSLSLFQMIQVPLQYISNIVEILSKARVASKRINEFLALPEISHDNMLTIHDPIAPAYIAKNEIISIENGSFGWDNETTQLKDVNLQVRAGDFIVIHGTVGCGKSSLFSAILGEMTKHKGQVYVGGSVAYCSQQPWIQNMTVRDNILFSHAFDRTKYDKVLDACALKEDLKTLPAGDQTEIGERGINISGGQKARIALARACYSDASIYVLDSPLSAVDAIVQKEIFQKCLLGLLRHKTVLLVTHNPEIIASEFITHAVTINDAGGLVETRQVQPRATHDSLVSPLAAKSYSRPKFDAEEDNAIAVELPLLTIEDKQPSLSRLPSISSLNNDGAEEIHKLIDDEDRQEGRVGFHVFAAYYRAIGGFPVFFVVFMAQVFWQALAISGDFWLSAWSTDATVSEEDRVSMKFRIEIYMTLGLASVFVVVGRSITVSWCGLSASQNLFRRMTHSLIHAPMRFFDTNPIGRILTRYSNDVSNVDYSVPQSFGGFLSSLFSVVCSLVTAAVIIRWRGFLLLPVCAIYFLVGRYYLQPAREIERLIQTTRAPIYSHLSESIEGGAVIRALGKHNVLRFQTTNETKLDTASKLWFAKLCVSQWFSLRIQMIGALIVLIVSYSLILLHDQISAAIVGLAFSYVLKIALNLERIIQAWSGVETSMVSPERVQEYIDIPQEAPYKIPTMDPPSFPDWPSKGSVQFQDVSFRYKENDALVLNDLNFSAQGGEKIGIVGRTGAGKSSLTMALFRINEIASGSITIDGYDVAKIGLKTLRSSLSIIPQNPVLFKGPLRHYLDPFDDFSDDELWSSIRQVGLIDRIGQEDKKLECVVEENGENFSVGERQMLCMAQALLRQTRVVVFDEATAAIDQETDKALQKVIRTAFASSTVLTIAHRLDTVLDSDKILVLDNGRVVEFAAPGDLVAKGSGHFFDLMQEGGYLEKFKAQQQTMSVGI